MRRCPCEYKGCMSLCVGHVMAGDSSLPHLHTMTAEVNSLSARQNDIISFLWFCRHHKIAAASLFVQALLRHQLCRVSKALVFLFKEKVTHIQANFPVFKDWWYLLGTVKYWASLLNRWPLTSFYCPCVSLVSSGIFAYCPQSQHLVYPIGLPTYT